MKKFQITEDDIKESENAFKKKKATVYYDSERERNEGSNRRSKTSEGKLSNYEFKSRNRD